MNGATRTFRRIDGAFPRACEVRIGVRFAARDVLRGDESYAGDGYGTALQDTLGEDTCGWWMSVDPSGKTEGAT
jgi:hypothetical protein